MTEGLNMVMLGSEIKRFIYGTINNHFSKYTTIEAWGQVFFVLVLINVLILYIMRHWKLE